GAVPLASEALALARQIRAPALIASGLLAVGLAVADTNPAQSRASLRESRELSTALGYQNALGLLWATGIAYRINDHAATLELGRRTIRGLQWGGDRLRMGLVLHMIAGALVAAKGRNVVRLDKVLGLHGSRAVRLEAVLHRLAQDELLNGKRLRRGAGAGTGAGAGASGRTQQACRDDRGTQPSSCTRAEDVHKTLCMRSE